MKTSVKTRANIISGCTVAALLALFFLAVGCGNDHTSIEQERVDVNARPSAATQSPKPTISITSTPVDPEPPVTTITPAPAEATPERVEPVTYAEAEAAFTEKRYNDAVDLFSKYTTEKSNNAWGFYMLGLSNWRTGDFERAKKAFESALDIDSRHVKSWINMSRVHLDDDNSIEAIAALDSALALDPENKTAYRLKGRALHQQGDTEASLAAYKHALTLDREDAWSMNNMALVLIDEQRFDEALPILALAVEINDQAPLFFNNLGMVLEHQGQYRAAEDAYASAVALDSTYDKAVANLARVEMVNEETGLEPVDLAEIAQNFSSEITGWQVDEEIEE